MPEVTVGLMLSDPDLSAQVLGALSEFRARVVMETSVAGGADEFLIDAELRRCNPDVVFLEVTASGERLPWLIRLIKSRALPPAVIGVLGEAQPEAILAAVRAGANDCLYPPIGAPALRQILDRAAVERERRQPRRPPARTAGFLSATGGCGGTTVACHFASELRRASGTSVLLADFDLTAGMVGFWMRTPDGYSIRDAVRALQRLDASLWQGLVTTVQPQFDVITAPAEVMMEDDCEAEQLLRVLRFARGHYDWVIADLGASLKPASIRLLGEMNSLVLVSTADMASLYQMRRIMLKLLALDYPADRVRLVLNRLSKQQQIRPAEVEKVLGRSVDIVLPDDIHEVEQAHGEGRLISQRSDLGRRIIQLVSQTVGQPREQKGGFWPAFLKPAQAREI